MNNTRPSLPRAARFDRIMIAAATIPVRLGRIAVAAAVVFLTPAIARAGESAATAASDSSGGSSGGSSAGSAGESSTGSSRASFGTGGGPFGEARQWVYSISTPDEFPFWLRKTGGGDWDLTVRPSLDVFLIRNVSVGGVVTMSSNGGGSDVGLGVRAGYNVPLTSLVSIWMRGGLYFHHTTVNLGPDNNQTVMDLTFPFLFHLVPHFFLGAGPFFHLPLQNTMMGGTDATYGLTAIVGGWF